MFFLRTRQLFSGKEVTAGFEPRRRYRKHDYSIIPMIASAKKLIGSFAPDRNGRRLGGMQHFFLENKSCFTLHKQKHTTSRHCDIKLRSSLSLPNQTAVLRCTRYYILESAYHIASTQRNRTWRKREALARRARGAIPVPFQPPQSALNEALSSVLGRVPCGSAGRTCAECERCRGTVVCNKTRIFSHTGHR